MSLSAPSPSRGVWEDDKAAASSADSQRKLRGLCLDDDLLTMQTYFRGCSDSFVRQADISLVTGGQEFPAHSQLISAFSSVFADMFDSCSISKENKRHAIKLEDPADQLLAFLAFVYRSVTKENRYEYIDGDKKIIYSRLTYRGDL
jgi:hypothetical protein